ncbi:MAG: hypothetical protein LBT42_04565 [Tannerella sp.]|nr:hypothetical protein [Tannerella sp.]
MNAVARDELAFSSTFFIAKSVFSTKYITKENIPLQQGAGQPHVYPIDLAKTLIHVTTVNIQDELICHINSLRQQAQLLQEEDSQTL